MTNPQSSKSYDVAILGWWYGKNYGSILTYYGLHQAVTRLGHRVLMVHEPLGYNGYRVCWPKNILSMQFARRMGYEYTEQAHYNDLPLLNPQVRTFVVGSDQLWNPLIGRVNDDLFLNFAGPDNRRVAYATSFGNKNTNKYKPDFVEKQSRNLQAFDAISVREDYAVDIARNIFGVDARQVVDPVFLLPRSDYDKLADAATSTVTGDYLALFLLDPTPEKRDAAVAVADRLNLQRIVVIPNPDGGRALVTELFADPRFEILNEDSPENFLNCYRGAQYVVTDSFHGSAFALIFERPFSSIYNRKRGVDRFENLMNWLGFGETRRLHETDSAEKISKNPNISRELDFNHARQLIEAGRADSLGWLKAALHTPAATKRGDPALMLPKHGLIGRLRDRLLGARIDNGAPKGAGGRIDNPEFTANNSAWQIMRKRRAARLSVAPDGSIRGNMVWCDLPFTLIKGVSYRFEIKWKPRTSGRKVNLHIRNPGTGRFVVIGEIMLRKVLNGWRNDQFDFTAPADGYSQFMLGAVHFTGPRAGADIVSISVTQISNTVANPIKKSPGLAELSRDMSLKDNERFVAAHRHSNSLQHGAGGARARLMFHAHAIEKGLSRSDFRAGFGKIAVPGLAKEMNSWLAAGRPAEDQFFRIGAAVMNVYFTRHADLKTDVTEFRKLFAPEVQAFIDGADTDQGGVLAAQNERETRLAKSGTRNFLDVIYGRRSIREFTAEKVDDADLRAAVHIAMQAPSVCNRQGARVRVINDQREIEAALKIQGGFSGYQMPPRLLLVTCDLTAFLFAAERNQPFIDGGLFMMALLLGLEQMGLGTCCLNTAMNHDREGKIRKILGIPNTEVFIAFIAVGHFDPAVLVPHSKRIAVEDVLISRKSSSK